MAVRAEWVMETLREEPLRVPSPPPPARRWPVLVLVLGAGVLLGIRLDLPGFFDNEGRYAEVAREMLLTRDWVTPHLDFTLFLNKPPLVFWLTALVFEWAGPTEWARLVPLAAALVTLYATCRLGALLYGEAAGLVGGIMLATSLGFVLEARTLRPDMLVTASVTVALLCWQYAQKDDRRRWWVGMYTALGVGILAKGFVAPILAGVPIVVLTLATRGWHGLRTLRPGLGLLVVGAIVLPWHVLVALRHEGFAWDYIVNQHLLFFLDRKPTRDSEGDALMFFWGAYLARAIPWSMLLPLTLGEGVRGSARKPAPEARATFFLWLWAGGTLVLFSATAARLEHYSLPALPAAALLAARVWQRARDGTLGRGAWTFLAGAMLTVAAGGFVGLVYGPRLLARSYWIAQMGLPGLAVAAAGVVLTAGLLAALAAYRRQPAFLVGALAASMVPLAALVLRAEVAAELLFSWRPVARALATAVPPEVEVVFEAPEEYQLVGGLAYYARRRITLLEPPGFVPPSYLDRQLAAMFLSRPAFERRWRAGEALAVVSDPLRRRDEPAGIAPAPFHVAGRFGDRWVLTNFPPRDAR